VRVTRAARDDLLRVVRFFAEKDPASARAAAKVLGAAFGSLARLP
jgi:plasmid stabilization system protein ParE